MSRRLIVNADDFGLSAGVNRGIIEAHERGIVTSASLMVRGAAAPAAARYAGTNARLSIGLHLDLAEWIFRDGDWATLYQVVDLADPAQVESEARRQVERFIDLMGRPPTHLDSHQHLHRDEPLHSVARRVAHELNVPLRHFAAVHYCGSFYGQTAKGEPRHGAIGVAALCEIIRRTPQEITELACHPGFADDLESVYRLERAMEVTALCDPRVRAVAGEQAIEFVNFSALGPN